MSERRCSISITAAFISVSQMLPVAQISLYEETINFSSKEHFWTKDKLAFETCTPEPIHPCHEDEEVETHGSCEVFEPEVEEKPFRKKKYVNKEA